MTSTTVQWQMLEIYHTNIKGMNRVQLFVIDTKGFFHENVPNFYFRQFQFIEVEIAFCFMMHNEELFAGYFHKTENESTQHLHCRSGGN